MTSSARTLVTRRFVRAWASSREYPTGAYDIKEAMNDD